MALSGRGYDHRTEALRDGLTAFWLLLWLVVGLFVGVQVWQLADISNAATSSAHAVDQAGQALESLGNLPVVGQETSRLGGQVRAAAHDVQANAEQTRQDVHRLSILLALSIALVPATPFIALYLPPRLARRRRVRDVEKALARGGLDPALEAYLAHCAVTELRYGELVAVSSDPVGDLVSGRHSALADVQLARLGLRVSRRTSLREVAR